MVREVDAYAALVFHADEQAFEALHVLWELHADGKIEVHGAAVIHREQSGHVDVATEDTDPGVLTIVGTGLGALLAALAAREGSGFVLGNGQAAVIAEISEAWTAYIDRAVKRLGGTVYRCTKSDLRASSFFGDDYADYLYPHDYEPHFHT